MFSVLCLKILFRKKKSGIKENKMLTKSADIDLQIFFFLQILQQEENAGMFRTF